MAIHQMLMGAGGGGVKGLESGNPFINMAEVNAADPGDGVYWISRDGSSSGTAINTFFRKKNGRYWAIAWVVTNEDGDFSDWWNGEWGGTNHFTSTSTLRTSDTHSYVKNNAKNDLFNYYSFTDFMLREDHNNTIGYRTYTLSSNRTFRGWFTSGASGNVRSATPYESGSFYAFVASSAIMFNNDLGNDGARMTSQGPSQECSGGIAGRVDGHQGYTWKGNVTRGDGGRHYNADGTTPNHTCWFFVG